MALASEVQDGNDEVAGNLSTEDFQTGGVTETTPPTGNDQPGGEQANPEPPTIRGLIGSLGYQLGDDVQDDYTALVHLTRQAAEAERLRQQQAQGDIYTQLGRQLAPRANEINQFLQQGQGQQQQQRAAYEPPPFDRRWEQLLTVEPKTGMYVAIHPNVPQEIVNAANEYREWIGSFVQNPLSVMEKFAEAREQRLMREQLPQIVEQRFQQFQQQQAVDRIVQQNAAWFYQYDATGNPIADPLSGQPKVTPLGRQYIEQVQWAARAGVTDPVMRDQFARRALAAEIAAATAPPDATTNPADAAAARQNRAMPASRPRVNPLQALGRQQRAETPGSTEPEQPLSFRDRMRKAFAEEGITNDQLMSEGAFGG